MISKVTAIQQARMCELLNQGVHPKVIAERLGVGFTTVYTHTQAMRQGRVAPTRRHTFCQGCKRYVILPCVACRAQPLPERPLVAVVDADCDLRLSREDQAAYWEVRAGHEQVMRRVANQEAVGALTDQGSG